MQRTLGVVLRRLNMRELQIPCWEMSGPWFLKLGPFSGQMLPFGNAPCFPETLQEVNRATGERYGKGRHGWKSPLLPPPQRAAK